VIPPEFVGAWRRVSIAVGDGAPNESEDVIWLQASSGFADLRMPRGAGGQPVAFAGYTTWDKPALTWHHELDSGWNGTDTGVVTWRGDDLVETGSTMVDGEVTTYEEVWHREPTGAGPISVFIRDDAGRCSFMRVRVGYHTLTIARKEDDFAARYEQHIDEVWTSCRSFGPVVILGSG
jgi:hypothetical protein